MALSVKHNSESNSSRPNWTDKETWALLNIWEENLKALKSQKRTSHVYERMAAELSRVNVTKTPRQVAVKIDNLTQKYRKAHRKMGSGGDPPTWPFYHELHRILSVMPALMNSHPHANANINDHNLIDASQLVSVNMDFSGDQHNPDDPINDSPHSPLENHMTVIHDDPYSSTPTADSPHLIETELNIEKNTKQRKKGVLYEFLEIQKDLVRRYDANKRTEHDLMREQLDLQHKQLELQEKMLNLMEKAFLK